FKEINSAYDVLGDAGKRALYDEFGEASLRPGFDAEQARQWKRGGFAGGFPGGGPQGGFGGGGGGADMEDLLRELFGGGSGQGFGRRERRGRDQRALLAIDPMLTFVGGETQLRLDGRAEPLKVRIPPGAQDGGKLRLKGQGLPPPGGGTAGDLILELAVAPHPILARHGDDLEMDVPI